MNLFSVNAALGKVSLAFRGRIGGASMPEIAQSILKEIGDDLSIDTMNVCVDIQAKGFLKRKKFLHIFGTVHTQDQIGKIEKIAKRHAGNAYEVVNHLRSQAAFVKGHGGVAAYL